MNLIIFHGEIMWWKRTSKNARKEQAFCEAPQAIAPLDTELSDLHSDKYLYWHAPPLRVISIFDEIKYDRSDLDIVSLGMRRHAIKKLHKFGFTQKSGHVLLQPETGIQCVIPKFVALGASPFSATRYHQRNEYDYWVFTPVQATCFIIENMPFDEAIVRIEDLLRKQPINLYKVIDFLERKSTHQPYHQALKELYELQKELVEKEPLKLMKAL
ncbi:MAG: hypothetical protein KGV50_01025 [Gammaproteobacteria bacterium]|nr:hypothetical protein [Gammaproteobacteria bacterium]